MNSSNETQESDSEFCSSFYLGDAKCVLENTQILNCGTGIKCSTGATLIMNQSAVSNCGTGLEVEDAVNIQFISSQMSNNNCAVFLKTKDARLLEKGQKKKILSDLDELFKLDLDKSLTISGGCSFSDNNKGNIVIVDQQIMVSLQHAEFLEDNYDGSGFKNTDVSMVKCANGHSSPIQVIQIDDDEDDNDDSSTFSKGSKNLHHNSTADISIISID